MPGQIARVAAIPYNVGQHRAKQQLKVALTTRSNESKLRRLEQVLASNILDRKDPFNNDLTKLAAGEISELKLRLSNVDDLFNIVVNETCKVEKASKGRAPLEPDAGEEASRSPRANRTCVNGCGRKPFKNHPTCCTHCKGKEGPHANACGETAAKAGQGDFSWIRTANAEEDRAARREVSALTERAILCRGYTMGTAKVKLAQVENMLNGTRLISPSKGSWPEAEEAVDVPTERPACTTEIRIAKAVVFQEAIKATLEGKRVVAVNAASAFHMGGGFKTGGRHALEEAMCVQSTLYTSLVQGARLAEEAGVTVPDWARPSQKTSGADWLEHVPDDGVVLSPFVEVFRGGTNDGYPFEDAAVKLEAVVSVAMPNCNDTMSDSPVDAHPDPEEYKAQLKRKWRAVFTAASQYTEGDTLVVPDAGCGVFDNPPDQVGAAFGEVLCEEFPTSFKEIIIAFPGGRKGEAFAQQVQAVLESMTRTPEAPE